MAIGTEFLGTVLILTGFTDRTSVLIRFNGIESITRFWDTGKTEYLNRDGGPSFFQPFPKIVHHRSNSPGISAGDKDISNPQGARLHKHSRNCPASFIYLCFNNNPAGRFIRVRLKFKECSFQKEHLKQKVDSCSLYSGSFNTNRLPTPIFRNEFMFC